MPMTRLWNRCFCAGSLTSGCLKSVGFFILVPKTREDVSTLNGIYVTDKDSV